jgi:hypothetical protein
LETEQDPRVKGREREEGPVGADVGAAAWAATSPEVAPAETAFARVAALPHLTRGVFPA